MSRSDAYNRVFEHDMKVLDDMFDDLDKEMAALRKDKARLDWLDARVSWGEHPDVVVSFNDPRCFDAPDVVDEFREAVDAAMEADD